MSSYVQQLHEKGLIQPPDFVPANTHYECIMGSVAYGVSSDTSDMDLYGFCIPRREVLFPHLVGEIEGFGRQKKRFNEYQQHHIEDKDAMGGKGRQYDVTIFNIAKYFQLVMENNPNMIDSLFVPENCVTHITHVGQMVRDARNMFLHRGSWHKFRGYAFQQLHKASSKDFGGIGELKKWEADHGLDHQIKFKEVEAEIIRRKISP